MKITKTQDGRANLHVWREGKEYFRQKSKVFLREWTNVMFSIFPQPDLGNTYYLDISKQPLNFLDNTFDAVYTYHVFEHLTLREGQQFALEIMRVLKPGGIFRISVPDLEQNCRDYLHYLEKSIKEPMDENFRRYKWSVLQVFEQIVRDKSGGLVLEAIRKGEYDEEYANEWFSDVYKPFFTMGEKERRTVPTQHIEKRLSRRLKSVLTIPKSLYLCFRSRIAKFMIGSFLRDRTALPKNHPLVMKEAVRWMYDKVSLRLLVESLGFVEFKQKTFRDSDIPNWGKYDLDRSNYVDRAIDPSVYIECKKPGVPR